MNGRVPVSGAEEKGHRSPVLTGWVDPGRSKHGVDDGGGVGSRRR